MPEIVTNHGPNNQDAQVDLFNALLAEIQDSYPVTLKMTEEEKQKMCQKMYIYNFSYLLRYNL